MYGSVLDLPRSAARAEEGAWRREERQGFTLAGRRGEERVALGGVRVAVAVAVVAVVVVLELPVKLRGGIE